MATTKAMAFKLCRQAEKRWRRLKGFEKLDLVAKDIKGAALFPSTKLDILESELINILNAV